nr:EAL domain-containing protein [Paraburkholderia phosphatilytica]
MPYPSGLAEQVLASERSMWRLLAANAPLHDLLTEVCSRAETLLGDGVHCSILLLDADGVHVHVGSAPSLPKEYSRALDGLAIGPRAGSCGTAIYERRLVVVEDIETDPLWADYCAIALPFGLRACWSVPFESDAGIVAGAFAVYHGRPRRPSPAEEAILRDIGRSVGLAVQRNAMVQRLAQSEEHHRLVVDNLNEGIVVQSHDGIVLACNPSAQRILRAPANIVGQPIETVLRRAVYEDGTPMRPEERPSKRALASGQPQLGVTLGIELVSGDMLWIVENAVPIVKPGDAGATALLISFTDIGPVREAQRQLTWLATHDSLTGLFNRAYLADRMRALLEPAANGNASRPTERMAVLFIDLDGFKKVNDTAGHEAGDALLRNIAQRLTSCVGTHDTLARVGGDEFVIAVSDYPDAASLIKLAQQVLDTIAKPLAVAGNEYYLSASIGISLYPDDGTDALTLMRHADSAMYYAKQCGRNDYQFFSAELNRHLQRRFAIEQSLRRALPNRELSLAWQPIVEGASGRIIGAEALLRWRSEEHGTVSPAEFIPVAEDTGMIVEIGSWVLERACEQIAEWRRSLAPNLAISVNLSPRQFDGGLVDHIANCLARYSLEPTGLELEITEGLLMGEPRAVLPTLTALTAMGVRVSLDDFGTGYSSLSYLHRFPLRNLKVDRSFVAGLPTHRDSVGITQAVVAMAHSLGMSVTAEGVETAEQAVFLRGIGCDRMQGYLFGRPVGAAEFAARLHALPDRERLWLFEDEQDAAITPTSR